MTDARVAIGLGSNLGDRLAQIRFAEGELARLTSDVSCSQVFETDPVHVADQPRFLNACCTARTTLSPRELLRELQAIEGIAGREAGKRYGPRTLDLDLLLFGDEVIDERGLRVPHASMHERAFVLVPLLELLPDWNHPILGRSVRELADDVSHEGVRLYHGQGAGTELLDESSEVGP